MPNGKRFGRHLQQWLVNSEDKMSTLLEKLQQREDFYCEKGASNDQIMNAEKLLGLSFADDYKEYLLRYGSISCCGHELTGFSADINLDVVHVTIHNREKNTNISIPLYVIEETHIDGIVVWQDSAGAVWLTEYNGAPIKKYESLNEYIATF